MKQYRFTTEKGNEVLIETEHSEEYYFGMYLTCKEAGWEHKWCSPSQLEYTKDSTLRLFSVLIDNTCGIIVPKEIFESLRKDYQSACKDTGKLIMATMIEGGKVIDIKIGHAIASVNSKRAVLYRMPEEMESRIRRRSKDRKIYCYGGIDDGPVAVEIRTYPGETDRYFFDHVIPDDPFYFPDEGEEEVGELVRYELEVKIVNPYKED